ncbi:MAG: KpsF/GutQ family sugar-phosphate isomerase [Candidatus Eisenbacteria sp.]|nr:KpsF/GutQ family sugar-phosphate isomerase [Candidatus Eisenbacteria bacterium]
MDRRASDTTGLCEKKGVLDEGKRVIRTEAEALLALEKRLGPEFERAVEILLRHLSGGGRVVVTGVGKSGIIGQKMAATFNSTGMPAFFLHPTEGLHGDLGMVTSSDAVIAISNSGYSEEIRSLLPWLDRLGVDVIAVTGNMASPLAETACLVLDASVEQEACPLGLAPTASSTVALAIGDALAVAVFQARGLDARDFAFRHPGGVLGKRLSLKVREIMHSGDAVPGVLLGSTVREAILEIINKRLGVTMVVYEDGTLAGLIADGDLKRMLVSAEDLMDHPVEDVMTREPRNIGPDELVSRALQKMEEDPERLITSLVVTDDGNHPIGIVHIHDCLRAGVS